MYLYKLSLHIKLQKKSRREIKDRGDRIMANAAADLINLS